MAAKAALLYALKGMYAVLTLALGAVVARLWGVESFGRFALLWTVFVIAIMIGGAGAGSYLIELLPKVEPHRYSRMIRTMGLITLAASALVTIPTFAVLHGLETYAAAALAIIPASFHTSLAGALVAEGRQVAAGAIDGVVRPGLTLAVTVVGALLGHGPGPSIATALLFSYSLSALAAALLVRTGRRSSRSRQVQLPTTAAPDQLAQVMLAKPLVTYVAVGVLTTLLTQADRFVLNALGSLRELATYSAAQNTSNIVVYAVNSAAVLVLPQIAAHLAGHTSRADLIQTMDHLCRPLVIASGVAALAAAALGDRVLAVFGQEFVEGRWPLAILLLGLSGSLMFGFPISVVTMTDARLWLLVYMSAGIVTLVALSAVMLPVAGAVGVAAANAVVGVGVRAGLHVHCSRAGLPTYLAVRWAS